MTFQPGNREQSKKVNPRLYRDALMMELKTEEGLAALRAIARATIREAKKGEAWAVNHIADRIDGKVPQALVTDDESGPLILQVVRFVVEPPPEPIDVTPVPLLPSTEEQS